MLTFVTQFSSSFCFPHSFLCFIPFLTLSPIIIFISFIFNVFWTNHSWVFNHSLIYNYITLQIFMQSKKRTMDDVLEMQSIFVKSLQLILSFFLPPSLLSHQMQFLLLINGKNRFLVSKNKKCKTQLLRKII